MVVPINNFLKPDEVNFILGDAGIDVLITDAELGAHHRALEAARPALEAVPNRATRADAAPEPDGESADGQEAAKPADSPSARSPTWR